jgi:hypothetical protein
MFDWSQTIILHELFARWFKDLGHLVQRSMKCATAYAELNLQLAQSNAKNVMLDCGVRQQRVAQEMAFEDSGRPWLNGTAAPRTVPFLPVVMETLRLQRLDLEHRAVTAPFILQRTAAAGTSLESRESDHPVRLLWRAGLAPVSLVAGSRSAGRQIGSAPSGIGFDWHLRRRSGRAEETFPGGAFLITQASLEPSILFLQTINLLLLFQALRTIGQAVQARGATSGVKKFALADVGAGASVLIE